MTAALEPPFGGRDAQGMAARIEGGAAQIEEGLARLEARPWPALGGDPILLAVGALGGSAISADLSAALYADRLPRPVLTVRDYHWPACVDREALALLSSYSGETEETLALYREAGERGVPRVAVTSGGTLAKLCERDGVPVVAIPGGSPPRAALYSSWVTLTALLRRLGWVDDPAPAWREAAAVLREQGGRLGVARPEAENPAKRLARSLDGRLVFVYAASERLGPVATRVRNQLNENAKLLGHSALAPELTHNEIVGWERPGPVHAKASVLILRDREDGPEVTKRLTLTAEFAAAQGAAVHEWTSSGEGRLARIVSLVQLGDYLSLYLALLSGVDPTPIASIDTLKRRLKAPGA